VSLAAVILLDVALWRGRHCRRWGISLPQASDPWPRQGRGGARSALRGVAPWLVLLAAALAWDVLGIDSGPHQYHLTISALAQAYRPLNAALLLVWVFVGVGYQAARVRAPMRDEGHAAERSSGFTPPGNALAATMGSVPAHGTTGLLLPQSPPVGIAFWVAVPLVAVVIDSAARRSRGRYATAEEFIRFISTAWPANLALIAAWIVAGYHLFAR
jgi:hypothetical protein